MLKICAEKLEDTVLGTPWIASLQLAIAGNSRLYLHARGVEFHSFPEFEYLDVVHRGRSKTEVKIGMGV